MTRPMSHQQYRIIQQVADARTDQQIAEDLGLTPTAVRDCISLIYRKLGLPSRRNCNRRVELTRRFWEGKIT